MYLFSTSAGQHACCVPLPQKVLHECQMLSAFGALMLKYYNNRGNDDDIMNNIIDKIWIY